MSTDPDSATTTVAPAPKKKLKLFIIVGGVVAAAALGGGVWFSGVLSPPHKAKLVETATYTLPVFVETPEMVTNLDAGPHRLSFVKVQCKIEVARPDDSSKLSTAMPRIVDMIQTYLRETRPEELRSDAGTYRLREALLLRASMAASNAEVKDVLFEELIVQ